MSTFEQFRDRVSMPTSSRERFRVAYRGGHDRPNGRSKSIFRDAPPIPEVAPEHRAAAKAELVRIARVCQQGWQAAEERRALQRARGAGR